eukprot:6491656-Amphidinium_carterae.2
MKTLSTRAAPQERKNLNQLTTVQTELRNTSRTGRQEWEQNFEHNAKIQFCWTLPNELRCFSVYSVTLPLYRKVLTGSAWICTVLPFLNTYFPRMSTKDSEGHQCVASDQALFWVLDSHTSTAAEKPIVHTY